MANGLFNLKQVVQAVQQGGWPAQKTPAVEYLVVAGGGGAGEGGGGGGGGGLLTGIDPVPNGQTLLITVGGGGAGGTSGVAGGSGVNSVFGSITAIGGGGGGTANGSTSTGTAGVSGGSGGGGSAKFGSFSIITAGQGTSGQGNTGGNGEISGGQAYQGGGGGGAGIAGFNVGTTANAVNNSGGAGIASAISGTLTAYAGGGSGFRAGGAYASYGVGGVGGGGNQNVAGATNTGGGGGSYNPGTSGGSGIVIVSYPDVYAAASATTGSPTVSTSGSGSIYMNGASGAGGGPYLAYPNSSTMQLGSGDFTIEAWCYFTVVQESTIVARYPFDATNNEWTFQTGSGLNPFFAYTTAGGNTSAGSVGPGTALSINTWYHIAVVRNSSTLTMYINGISVATSAISATIYSGTTTSTVGCYAQSAYPNGYAVPNGYLSNVRVVKGTAVYTSNFTPSTTPLTAISGTSLLLNTVSGSYTTDSSTNSFTPSAPSSSYGKPAWNQLSPFTGTGYKNRVYTWTTSGSITF